MANQTAMIQAILAFQRQAQEWVAGYNSWLAANGLGFTAADRAAIAAAHAAYPVPVGHQAGESSPEDIAKAQDMAARAMAADYPPNGFAGEDPRLTPEQGVSLVQYAIAAKAIGWSPDPAHADRVARALGMEPATWQSASAAWSARIWADAVLAAFYGQLFASA